MIRQSLLMTSDMASCVGAVPRRPGEGARAGHAPPPADGGPIPPTSETLLCVVYEDEDLLVLNKPAGLVCHPAKRGLLSSISGRVRLHLGMDQPVHLINRLDRETSGLIVVAKNVPAARRLRRLWAEREVEKVYWALVHGHVEAESGTLEDPLGPDEASPIAVKDCVRPDGVPAQTRYSVERRFARPEGCFTWLKVRPHTGRKHQIRIHLAHLGHPIVGDKVYGHDPQAYLDLVQGAFSLARWPGLLLPFQALHAHSLAFDWNQQTFRATAEPEAWFTNFRDQHPLTPCAESSNCTAAA